SRAGTRLPPPPYLLGRIAEARGQFDLAQERYQKSLQLNGDYFPARRALADLFLRKGDIANARTEIQKLLASRPQYPSTRLVKTTLDIFDRKEAIAEKELLA